MKTSIKKTLVVSALALSSSLFTTNSYAVPISGSSSIDASGVTITGTDLTNPGDIAITTLEYDGNDVDYSPIPLDAVFTLGALNLAVMASWNITGPDTVGTYTVSQLEIIGQSPGFLNVFTRGLFIPGINSPIGTQSGGCATGGNTCDATDTSLRWSFTQSGTAVSASATLNSPAVPLVATIPEPASLSLLGLGLIGCMVSHRKSTKKAELKTQEGCA